MFKDLSSTKEQKVTDFTRGEPAGHIMRFFWPLLFTSMLQQIYNFVDMMIVGSGIGDNALAAVGNMGSLFFLIVGFSLGLATGFGILIAQSFGAGETVELRHRFAGTIRLSLIMSVILTLVSVICLPWALRLINTDEILMADCLRYGYIIFGGLAASISFNVSAAVLRSLGDSRTPLKAIILSSAVNLILDCLFIFVLHTGVGGAAAATVISQVVSAWVNIRRIRRIEILKLTKEDFRNDASVYRALISNGIPMAFMNSITAVGCMVVQYFINGMGVDYTTAYTACSKYLNIFMNPAASAGGSMNAFTSQNYGAGNFKRIKSGLKVCLTISFVTYLLTGILMIFFPEVLAGILIKGEEPIRLAASYLPVTGIALIMVDCLFVFRSGVQGMGKPIVPMWSGVLEMALRIAVISLFIGSLGFKAAAYAEICAWTGALALNVIAFRKAVASGLRRVRKPDICAAGFR